MMSPLYLSINNKLYLEKDAKIAITDLSIQRGYGVFDFLKTIDNRPVFIKDHLNRFFNSAKEMHLSPMLDRFELENAIRDLMEKNNMPNSGIKIILTGGYSEDGYSIGNPNLIIQQTFFQKDESKFDKGMKLITYQHQRQLPHIKTIDYLQAVWLQPYINEHEADDVLYYSNNMISECPRANFFVVKNNQILTPKSNVLQGITRSKILSLEIPGYQILEENIELNELANVQEAFITSTTKGAFPVLSIDGKKIGDGGPGELTKLINEKLNLLVS